MTIAKVSPQCEIRRRSALDTPSGYKKIPVPMTRDGDCALLLLDLNQQPFD